MNKIILSATFFLTFFQMGEILALPKETAVQKCKEKTDKKLRTACLEGIQLGINATSLDEDFFIEKAVQTCMANNFNIACLEGVQFGIQVMHAINTKDAIIVPREWWQQGGLWAVTPATPPTPPSIEILDPSNECSSVITKAVERFQETNHEKEIYLDSCKYIKNMYALEALRIFTNHIPLTCHGGRACSFDDPNDVLFIGTNINNAAARACFVKEITQLASLYISNRHISLSDERNRWDLIKSCGGAAEDKN